MSIRRFPSWVFGRGSEPDPRFSLANERTFLAWIRTAVALFAAGVALEAVALQISPWLRLVAALIFVVLGLVATVQAWLGWAVTERSMRQSAPLAGPSVGVVIAAGSAVAILIVGLGLIVR